MQNIGLARPQRPLRTGILPPRLVPIGLLAVFLCIGFLGGGCTESGNTPPVKALPSAAEMRQQKKAQGGGVDDMTVYPAPAGQKTGLDGGKK